jgi:bifunctional DNA-binding transcriptional regulator/antitoxin component of YhaV-PrlF toxin-antitoxin module
MQTAASKLTKKYQATVPEAVRKNLNLMEAVRQS